MNGREITSWILCGFAYGAGIVFFLIYLFAPELFAPGLDKESIFWIAAVSFIAPGMGSHFLIKKYRRENRSDFALWIITFPPVICGIIFLVFIIIVYAVCEGSTKTNSNSRKSGKKKVYHVKENGIGYELTFLESGKDNNIGSPNYGKKYNRFQDDIGRYWRSYNNNRSFRKER